MNRGTAKFNIRSRIGRMLIALIAYGITALAGMGVISGIYLAPFPALMMIVLYLFGVAFIPLYFMLRLYWGLDPAYRRSTWSRNAKLIAATCGTASLVIVYVGGATASAMAGIQLGSGAGLLFVAGCLGALVTMLLFGRLRPGDDGGPLWRRKRTKRIEAGLCVACGYDLKGNVSGVCPECGKPLNRG